MANQPDEVDASTSTDQSDLKHIEKDLADTNPADGGADSSGGIGYEDTPDDDQPDQKEGDRIT
jgi:hypothetical protein